MRGEMVASRIASEDTKGANEWYGLAAPFNGPKGFYKSSKRTCSVAHIPVPVLHFPFSGRGSSAFTDWLVRASNTVP